MKATEENVQTAKFDVHEAQTCYARHQRQQLREHETERRLTHELRQAESYQDKLDLPTAKLRQELHQSQQAARAEAE